VEKALQKALSSLKWFPTPSEVRELLVEEIRSGYNPLQIEDNFALTRERAHELLRTVFDKYEQAEVDKEKKRAIEFEKKRKELKKQARLIEGADHEK
jgi:hypothetical protein